MLQIGAMASSAAFLDEVERLREWLSRLPEARPARPPAFALEPFLRERVEALPDTSDAASFRILDRMCKKVDVLGRLHAFYREDLSRPIDRTRLAAAYLPLFAGVLLLWAEGRRDAKLLNSALKLLDFDEFDRISGVQRQLLEGTERVVAELVQLG